MSKYINGRTTELTNNSDAVSREWLAKLIKVYIKPRECLAKEMSCSLIGDKIL